MNTGGRPSSPSPRRTYAAIRQRARVMVARQAALVPATLFGFWLFGWPAFFLWLLTVAVLPALGFEALCAEA
jgi:Na+-translocating ferredoxin:NAD+ oxidoreductase RnfD subunit